MKAVGLSLWLVPEPSARRRLARVIARLSRRLGTERFVPHLTLIGSVMRPAAEVVSAASRLAAASAPFRLTPARVGDSAEPLRCLYLAIAPAAPLARLRARALAALGPARRRYFAHLSLVYGDLDRRTRRTLTQELSRAACEPFRVARLQVVRTQGEPREWRRLAEFALRNRSRT